jgi:hypothetical protein
MINLQDILVSITFLGAVAFMLKKFWPKKALAKNGKKSSSCGTDCGCN